MKSLTDYAECAGCASKFQAADLDLILDGLPRAHVDDRVLVDFETADDAGVYRWSEDSALVQTVDFFTPIVDDPYVFGQIAAANSLSDVYAMGGEPRTALAIAALPKDGPAPDVIRAIFRGGSDKLREAGVALLGGHTVSDPEVKFGYAVTGHVHPKRVFTNAGAKVGDVLILTKAIGTGVVVRATKFGRSTDKQLTAAIASMLTLNNVAARIAAQLPDGTISACTDITGFGLFGHATEVAKASGTTLVFRSAGIPMLPGAMELAAQNLPCGGRSNIRHFSKITVDPGVLPEVTLLAMDPQTSGGLLFSVEAKVADGFLDQLIAAGVPASIVGNVQVRESDGTLVHLH
ncbi:MAG TPA: selenide, water dikinase SelD [Vicinamibacterales bacterium]|nr:selenide, water dikinase SelD [Vicinamibacterales bacterium]